MSDPAREAHDELERLRRRVEELDRRLLDVEAVLARLEPPPLPQPPPLPPRAEAVPQPGRAVPGEGALASGGRVGDTNRPYVGPSVPPLPSSIPRIEPARPAPWSPRPAAPRDEAPESEAPRPERPSRSIEALIGQNWASWVGAVVLFLGVVFFLKYAWDQGWIRPSPAARVAAAVACGAALAAAGEWLHWRRMRALAGTLWGAGVAVVIASWFGAHAYFEPPVLAAIPAFAAVAVTAAIAILAAIHIDVSVVAMIGLIGAYLAPNLLGSAQDRSTFFMLYLAVLALAALGVAHVKRHWVLLRWLALASTYLWLTVWWGSTGHRGGHETLVMITLIGFAALFVLDAVAALWRTWQRDPRADVATFTEFFGVRVETGPLHVHVVLASFLSIVGSMLLLAWSWDAAPASRVGLVAVAMAALLAGPGLVLCHLRPAWATLRWAVLVASYAWLALWWVDAPRAAGHETLAVVWALALYAAFLIEGVLVVRRAGDKPLVTNVGRNARVTTVETVVAGASLLSTAGCLGMLLWVWGITNPVLVGAIAVVLALAQAGAALVARSRDFFVSSMLQATALLTLAVPLLLDRFAVTLAWMIMGALLGLAAWQLNLPKARGWAAALLLLALGRIILFDTRDPALTVAQFHLLRQPVTRWLMTGWTVALLYHLLAWLRPGAGRWPALELWLAEHIPAPRAVIARVSESESPKLRAATVLDYTSHVGESILPGAKTLDLDRAGAAFAAFGTICFAAFTAAAWNGALVTLALTGWFAGLLALAPRAKRIGYGVQAWVLGALLSVRWLVFDNLIPLAETWRTGGNVPAVTNLPALCGALLAAAIVLGIRAFPHVAAATPNEGEPRAGELSARQTLIVWAAAIAFALVNFETIRYVDTLARVGDRAIVKQVALSVLWALSGFAAVLYGFRRRVAAVRWAALVLLGVTLAKILVVDMAEVKAIWRILSFVAVGLLLLCVSFVYHKQTEPADT